MSTTEDTTMQLAVQVIVLVPVPDDITEEQMRERSVQVRDQISATLQTSDLDPEHWLV